MFTFLDGHYKDLESEEGHGIRTFPAKIDHAARIVDWFERYLGNNHDSL